MAWYKEGLKFKCTGCGACCTGEPGYVWLDEEDIERLSHHFEMEPIEFLRKYTRVVSGRISLLECDKTYDCVLLDGKLCSAYAARPKQCRKFPWWEGTLKSKRNWEATAKECEGINHPEGKLYTIGEIEKKLCED